MPALRPARLWVLLALWLCRAAPTRGEYPAGGAASTPRTAVPAPPGHLGGPFRPLRARRAGLCRGIGARPLGSRKFGHPGRVPSPARPAAGSPRRVAPHTRLPGPGSKSQKLPFSSLEFGVAGSLALLVPRFPGLKGNRGRAARDQPSPLRTAEGPREGMPGPGREERGQGLPAQRLSPSRPRGVCPVGEAPGAGGWGWFGWGPGLAVRAPGS